MIIILTYHAKQQMAQRAINIEHIKRAIQRGSKVKQSDGFLASYADLQIAYKIRGTTYIIKTVMVR